MDTFDQSITTAELHEYQSRMLLSQLSHAAEHSSYYKERLASFDRDTGSLESLAFMSAEDIVAQGECMLCVHPSEVQRIVSLPTSGSSGEHKRIYFSAEDLAHTVSFFTTGMLYLCCPGDRVMIMFPGRASDGLVRLLQSGLERLGAEVLVQEVSDACNEALAASTTFKPHTIVGAPTVVRRLAMMAPELCPRTVLLSSDYVANSVRQSIKQVWGSEVFTHYGLTETGYGCAVECSAHNGQHIRHDEFMVEIIDPQTNRVLPAGEWGEVVFTTLRREAMPLIRYRTGDISRLIDEPCACGSALPRLDRVLGRAAQLNNPVTIYQLDEVVLSSTGILDYRAELQADKLTVWIDATEQTALDQAQVLLASHLPNHAVRVIRGCESAPLSSGKRSLIRNV